MTRQAAKKFCEITGIPNYLVRAIASEFRMIFIRLYAFLPFQNYKIKSISSANKQINIIFGCGCTSYSEWVGIDCFFSKSVDFVLDLRRKLPFKNESVDLCYSEHFIEHLHQNEVTQHLNEVFRILKPGGRYRVVVPAAFRFIDRYNADDKAFFALAFPWADRPMDAVRDILYFAGDHKNVYDHRELNHLGVQAGFDCVLESSANKSEIEILQIDRSEDQRVAESLYVEMIKNK